MTYLQYNQINLGEGESVDLEQDLARANEERSIAIRSFASACIRRLQGILHVIAGHVASWRAVAVPRT